MWRSPMFAILAARPYSLSLISPNCRRPDRRIGEYSMLAAILDLEPLAPDRYSTRQHLQNFRRSLFGGQVLAQALMAAGLTVHAGRPPHSLHAYFLRAGHPNAAVEFTVE